jgi:hypothetical protein
LLPALDLVIVINGSLLKFKLDGCYWTVLVTGLVALLTGSAMLIIELRHPGSLAFDLEVDSDIKEKLINKVVERRSVKQQPSLQSLNPHKPSLKSKVSVVDATATAYVEKSEMTSDTKLDSGFGVSTESSNISGLLSHQMDSVTDLEQIATMDGSYLKSTVTNVR